MGNIIAPVRAWLEEPFVGQVSVSDLFWLTGLVLVLIVVWNLILYHVRIAAEEIV